MTARTTPGVLVFALYLGATVFGFSSHAADVEISEFLAANGSGLVDEDGDRSDWIELHNVSNAPVDLGGWGLTDSESQPFKWAFPSVTMGPDTRLVVFASGKDRGTVGGSWDTIIRSADVWKYVTGDGVPSASWTDPAFDDAGWSNGVGGFGYGDGDDATIVPDGTLSVFVRKRFSIEDPTQVLRALLHVTYDDGFVAYINGTEVARANCCASPTPVEPGPLEEFTINGMRELLRAGENVLAIQVRNASSTSSDLSLIPFLSIEFSSPQAGNRGVAPQVGQLASSYLHTNFSLNRDGEYLALVEPGGTPVSEFDPFPPQFTDVSYGRMGDGYRYFENPTPGAANSQEAQGKLSVPTLSMNHGFFEQPFPLFMFPETPGSTIRYTTDGSLPTETNGITYTEPLRIDRTTVVRAVAVAPGYITSESVTRTYLFTADIIRQSANGAPPPGWPARWGNNATDYGMDPDVVNGNESAVTASLLSLPSFSIVTDRAHLFDEQTGIYSNALRYGREWERPTSIELIHPDGTAGFQINAGIRIRGGYSRNNPNPKHAFRFYFRNEYGPGKLSYPLFGHEGVDEFDTVDLRTSQNYSWAYNGDARNTMVREVWARDTQRAMNQPYTRSRYYHLYINGQYWGVFQTQERAEASYGESYFGGDKEEYDTVKSAGLADGYVVEVTDGNFDAWRALWEGANSIAQSNDEGQRTATYMRLQGRNPDGSRNSAYDVLLDADNLIDYMLVIFYTGNFDSPISGFIGNEVTNNFFSVRRRGGDRGFAHFAHDNEHTFLPEDGRYQDRTGPYPAGFQFTYSNPQWIHQQLMASSEYRLRFADRAQKHLFNGGVLTTAPGLARLEERIAQVGPAMLAESARWGDSKTSRPLGPSHWQNEVNRLRSSILPPRNGQIVSQLQNTRRYNGGNPAGGLITAPLFPAVAAPSFNQYGGEVAANFGLQMSAPAGEIFYTLDGSDPRAVGGSIAPGATAYTGTLTLQNRTVASARVRSGSAWSPLIRATFLPGTVAPAAARLIVTEIHYNPPPLTDDEVEANFDSKEAFEFIELANLGNEPLDLWGVQFTEGIRFSFTSQILQPGARAVLVANPAAFSHRYGGSVGVHGVYEGQLSNGGERLTVVDADGSVLHSFAYSDSSPWPTRADGAGSSLEIIQPDADPTNPLNWRASFDFGGSPGTSGSVTSPGVVVNEVLTHTDEPQRDAIELYNTLDTPVDIGGWYLSDSGDYRKYRIPDGTIVAARGYLVFDESHFNADSTGFALDGARGEAVWLLEADAGGRLLRFSDNVAFPAAFNGESYGRWPNGSGALYPMADLTLGAENTFPRIGPVVIREIMYEPPGNNENLEYIEIFNAGSDTEDLSNWSVGEAVTFSFPSGLSLAPGQSVVVVSFDPHLEQEKGATFQRAYGYFGSTPVVGPWSGRLDNAGETILLFRPDDPPTADPTFFPQVLEDRVSYRPVEPWPTLAAGGGAALRRVDPFGFPDDPMNWSADAKAIETDEVAELPSGSFTLGKPFPNPARGASQVYLGLPTTQHVRVELFDILGRRVADVHSGVLAGGQQHILSVDLSGLASGLYLIRATGDRQRAAAPITVVR